MGQAVDLPDPSEIPAAHANSADDLLSQLAGEEIDRLLAEAEVEKGKPLEEEKAAAGSGAPGAPPADAASATGAKFEDEQTEAQLDELLDQLSAEPEEKQEEPAAANATAQAPAPAESVAPAPATPPAAAEDLPPRGIPGDAKQDASSIAPATVPPAAPVAEAAPAPAPAAPSPSAPTTSAIADPSAAAKELDEALATGSADSLPKVQTLDAGTSNAEKNALSEVVSAMHGADPAADLLTDEHIPIYLKPLVWLNAPLEMLPEGLRDALGKIAILTLANAVAVFAYVVLFRKHH